MRAILEVEGSAHSLLALEVAVLAIVAALLFLIACIIEIVSLSIATDALLTNAGLLLLALYVAGVGPRSWRRWW